MDFKLNKSNLNFRVYTAASLPETGQENDICIVSDVPMKNWILSPDTPKGAPRNDGDVWIRYAVTGKTFNALKNGAMVIATISAMQYIDGAWVDKDVLSYQNGAWVGWIENIVLFDNGVKRDGLDFTTNYGTATFSGNYLVCKLTSSNQTFRAYVTEQFDLAPYKTITVTWEGLSQSGSAASFGVGVYKNGERIEELGFSAEADTCTLDVSDLDETYDICLRLYSASSGKTANVTYFAILK